MFRLHKIDNIFGTGTLCDCGERLGRHRLDNGHCTYNSCTRPTYKRKPVWFINGVGWCGGTFTSIRGLHAFLNGLFYKMLSTS